MNEQDEIARLRALWCEEKSKSMTFYALVERLRAENARLRAENARLTAERDEARRDWCYTVAIGYERAEARACLRGWDCFKEVRP
jgi:hypothetical protein